MSHFFSSLMNTTLPKQDLSVFKHSFPQETAFEVLNHFLVGVYVGIVASWTIHLAKCILSQWVFFLLLMWHGWSVKNAVLMTILQILDQKPDFSDILPRKENSRHDTKTKALSPRDSIRNKAHCHTRKDQKAIFSLDPTKERDYSKQLATHRLHENKNSDHFEASQTTINMKSSKTLGKPVMPAQKTHQTTFQAPKETKNDSTEVLLRQLEALEKQKEPTMSEIDAMYYQGIIPSSWTPKLNFDCNHQLAPTYERQSFDRMQLLTVQEPTHPTHCLDQRQGDPFVYPSSASFGFKKSYKCREDQASNHMSTHAVVGSSDTIKKQNQKMSLKGFEAQQTRQTTTTSQQPFAHKQPISPFQKKPVSIPSRHRKSTRFTLSSKRQREQYPEAGLDQRTSVLSSDNTKCTNITLRSANMTENLSIDSIKQVLAEKVFDHDQQKVNIVCRALEASLAQKNKNATVQESDKLSTNINEKSIFASQESFVSSLTDSNRTILDKEAN
ncbi:uncharacterized protein B0P05DRAFT_584222 [Gilbertella persicaria]|uniref:uncharacterized protein n=1 Tax=Gilbertella persicaria TaxID=101096 RepID=UPI0022206933|nr:uncharacterized protein B0P05DRAFT_584222 [Gilbertella persicaria]KAI8091101.1 hypothetical protein B0P05DRAFT_584222 [Gilbertella persicaria]